MEYAEHKSKSTQYLIKKIAAQLLADKKTEPGVRVLLIPSEIKLINTAVTEGHTLTETGITFICNHGNFSLVYVSAAPPITCHYLFQAICTRFCTHHPSPGNNKRLKGKLTFLDHSLQGVLQNTKPVIRVNSTRLGKLILICYYFNDSLFCKTKAILRGILSSTHRIEEILPAEDALREAVKSRSAATDVSPLILSIIRNKKPTRNTLLFWPERIYDG